MAKKVNKNCTIYIVRHGETEWNVKQLIQGHTNSPLTKKGIAQAKAAADRLKIVNFDMAFSSDLFRAKKTAEIISLEHKLAVVSKKELRERNFGKYEGYPYEKFRKELKGLLAQFDQLSDEAKFDFKFPGNIESLSTAVNRLINFLRNIALAYPGKNILVVTHGAIMRFFLLKIGFANSKSLGFGAIDNLAHICLESDGIEFFIKSTFGVHLTDEN